MTIKKQDVGIWVKDKLPDTKGYYCCKIIIDGIDDDMGIIEYDGKQWGEAADYVYETLDIISWLKLVNKVYVLTQNELEDLCLKAILNYKPELPINTQSKQFIQSITK